MLHLTPLEYPKLIRRTLHIENIDINNNEIIFTFTGTQCRMFYGKKILFTVNNMSFYGKYYVRETVDGIEHYFKTNKLPDNILEINGKEISILETFVVNDDNKAITYQDFRERIENEQEDAIVNINKITSFGVPGLISGIDSLKLKSLNYDFKFLTNAIISNYYEKPIITVKLEQNKLNRYKLFLYNNKNTEGNFINIEITVDNYGDYCYIKNNSHFSQEYNLSNEILKYTTDNTLLNNYELKLNKIVYNDNTCYLAINIRLLNFGVEILQGYFSCNSPQDLWENNSEIKYTDNIKLNNNETIIINSSLLFADSYGEQKTFTLGDTITRAIPLGRKDGDSLDSPVMPINIGNLPVGYYRTNAISCILDGPCSENDNSEITGINNISKNDWNSADIIVFNQNQSMYITDTGEIFIGKKVNLDKYEWFRLSKLGHQHTSGDIDDSDDSINKKFVTKEQIKLWTESSDNISNISWINCNYPLESLNETQNTEKYNKRLGAVKLFPNQIGNYAGNDMLFANLGNGKEKIPLSIGALKVENIAVKDPWNIGCLIKQETINELGKLGIGIRIPETIITQYPNQTYREQYVLIDNSINYYQHDGIKSNKFFDLVKRTSQVTIGNYSINIGFDNQPAFNYSVLYGNGLLNEFDNQIILGNYNTNTTKDIKFVIGIGTSNDNRKNALWYRETESGDFLHTFGKLKLEYLDSEGNKIPNGYILVNGEDPIENNFATIDDISKINEKLDKLTIAEISVTKFEDLTTGENTFIYNQNKPLNYLPIKVIINGISETDGSFDNKWAIFVTNEENTPITSESNVEVFADILEDNNINLYVNALYSEYVTILDRISLTGKKYKISEFFDKNNALLIAEINQTSTGAGITNVLRTDVIEPLEISF